MGFLDDYLSRANFGDQPGAGGILGMLINNMPNLPPPGQPSQGFGPTDVSAVNRNGTSGVTLPQQGASGFGRDGGPGNPFASLFGGLGDAVGGLFNGGGQQAPQQMPGAQQAPQMPQQGGPMAPQGPGVGDRLGAAWQGLGHGGLTSALGGLFTGQRQDPEGLLERALVARGVSPDMAHAGVKNPTLLPTLMAEQGQGATYQALVQAGVPPGVAHAAALNPEVLKTIAPQLYTKPTIEKVKNALGGEDLQLVDAVKGTSRALTAEGGGPSGGGQGGPQMLAAGVKQYNPALTGEDYMSQFGPEIQDIAKMFIRGDQMPTGNPRIAGIIPFAKTVATKYAQDMGIPFSDALYSEKRKFFTDLGSTSPTALGGQVKAFNQGIEHAEALATKLEKLGNYDPIGIAPVAHGVNWVRGLSTKQADIVNEAKTLGQTLAGEVGKLFSGSAGGGVHERQITRDRFDTISSPRELAGALEGTIETMKGGLTALEQRRDQVLGPNNDVKFVTKDTEAKIARIQQVIDRLRGQGGVSASDVVTAPGQAALAAGRYIWSPQGGIKPQ